VLIRRVSDEEEKKKRKMIVSSRPHRTRAIFWRRFFPGSIDRWLAGESNNGGDYKITRLNPDFFRCVFGLQQLSWSLSFRFCSFVFCFLSFFLSFLTVRQHDCYDRCVQLAAKSYKATSSTRLTSRTCEVARSSRTGMRSKSSLS
jgi:hypothetical protein